MFSVLISHHLSGISAEVCVESCSSPDYIVTFILGLLREELLQADDVLPIGRVKAVGYRFGYTSEQLAAGVNRGQGLGYWTDAQDCRLRLTSVGYREMWKAGSGGQQYK